MWESWSTGLAISATLIVAIGAQNAFVLRQGLRGEQVALVVALCAGIDLVLMAMGVAGVAKAAALNPLLLDGIRWAGAAFLIVYGIRAARRAFSSEALLVAPAAGARGAGRVAAETLAVTLLNPHVYLDTLLLVGAVGSQQASRGAFVAGAAMASAGWFSALGFGARSLAPWFAKPLAWRVLDAVVAATMWVIAATLLLSG